MSGVINKRLYGPCDFVYVDNIGRQFGVKSQGT